MKMKEYKEIIESAIKSKNEQIARMYVIKDLRLIRAYETLRLEIVF